MINKIRNIVIINVTTFGKLINKITYIVKNQNS